MPFSARVYRILIASPSDVEEERKAAVSVIQAWNDLNSSERQIVLLPLMWETHSAPEYGRRPQEVINRQVVDHSDLLVGVFWTRIGSPTEVADSGTLEEIERVAKQGKTVMLYFSQVKQDPDQIDPDQLKQLHEFKKKTLPDALVETYSTLIEFRDKLQKQLEIQIRALVAKASQSGEEVLRISPTTDIHFGFADLASGKPIGSQLQVQSTLIQLEGRGEIPDYEPPEERSAGSGVISGVTFGTLLPFANKDYYREMVEYLVRQHSLRPLRFWISNRGGVGARDIYVDIRISSDVADALKVIPLQRLDPPNPSTAIMTPYPYFVGGGTDSGGTDGGSNDLERTGDEWTTQLEISALQPQRELSPLPAISIGAVKSALISLTAKIYADTLPQPATQALQIDWTVNVVKKKALELLRDAGIKITPLKHSSEHRAAE